MDLVDDHRVDRAQDLTALRGSDQEVERLRRGDHEARRSSQHRRTLGARGVAGAHGNTEQRRVEPELDGDRGDLGQRTFEVLGDVDGERLQREP